MASISKLIAHCGARFVDPEILGSLPTPPATRTFQPVPHATLVKSIRENAEKAGLVIDRTQVAIGGKDGSKLFGVMDLGPRPDLWENTIFRYSIGFRASNDRRMSIQMVTGARVIVCDNMAFFGDGVMSRRRHSSGLDLDSHIAGVIREIAGRFPRVGRLITRLRMSRISSPNRARRLIYEAFLEKSVLPIRLLPKVHDLYFNNESQAASHGPIQTMWGMNNCFTEAAKLLKPSKQIEYGVKVGRMFGEIAGRYDDLPRNERYVPDDLRVH